MIGLLKKSLFFVFALIAVCHAHAEPTVIVIFGATGDLTARKILPAIYNLDRDGQLPDGVAIVGVGRRPYDNEIFRKQMHDAVNTLSRTKPADQEYWSRFEKNITYHQADFEKKQGIDTLAQRLDTLGKNRIFYLATQPSHFAPIIENLDERGLISDSSKVIIEKPFGRDLSSALDLQKQISQHLDESQIYRIDHYLGKQGVLDLSLFRSEGSYEPLWNKDHIDHVQITISEEIGIGTRAHLWEETGLLRDMFQNHLMQLLALTAMELPASSETIHAEKIKLLNAIRPIPADQIDQFVVRGQYGPGNSKFGYRQEKDVPAASNVETFMAAKLFIDNDRWEGVPFYLRAGKRLAVSTAEIAVVFKDPSKETLFLRIQPLDKPAPEAYETLIAASIRGDSTLFVDTEEHLAAWRWLTPILDHWEKNPPPSFPNYSAGSWGPIEADHLIETSGQEWVLMSTLSPDQKSK